MTDGRSPAEPFLESVAAGKADFALMLAAVQTAKQWQHDVLHLELQKVLSQPDVLRQRSFCRELTQLIVGPAA